MSKPKLMVMGMGGHGKNTVCEILRDTYGYTFTSSSEAALSVAIWPAMLPYYDTKRECFADRHNWRTLWYELIRLHNHEDPTSLAAYVYKLLESDIYCGMRSDVEFNAVKARGLFDLAVWVDASKRVPPESSESIQVTAAMADHVLDNNGDMEQLLKNVFELVRVIECR